jgi:hypothetical protein
MLGPPLDRRRTYHPRPYPEKIIEQLDPERITDLSQGRAAVQTVGDNDGFHSPTA